MVGSFVYCNSLIIMQLNIIPILNTPDLENIKDIYTTSFPPSERREFDELSKQLNSPYNILFKITYDHLTVGMASLWNFYDFVYLEHLAIDSGMWGNGMGTQTMKILLTQYQKPFILEIEPPTDTLTEKRVQFYTKLGFVLLPDMYMQPAYSKNKPMVELQLMTNLNPIAKEGLLNALRSIHKNVYGVL